LIHLKRMPGSIMPNKSLSGQLSRRRLIAGAASTGVALVAAPALLRSALAQSWLPGNPFSLGVASGAPRSDGFVLWTRLAPEPMSTNPETPGGMRGGDVAIDYEIATDAAMHDVVRKGEATAERAFAYSVHLDVSGLEPGRPYWYRFMSGDATSSVGRAVTVPAAGASLDKLRFGFVSCSNYEHGFFSAYRHLTDENPDVVLFLGDYIYDTIEENKPTGAGTATACRRRRCRSIATAMRNTGSIPTCKTCTRERRRWLPGTTTRSRTITPTNGRNGSSSRRDFCCSAPPPTRRSTSTCRCGRSCRIRKGR
jgi:alkaline phosphatase D